MDDVTMRSIRILITSILLLLFLPGAGLAGNVIVRNGQLNVSEGFYSDSNTLYVDSSNNRVGIGTTSPNYNLHLHDTAAWIQLTASTGGSTSNDGLFLGMNNNNWSYLINKEDAGIIVKTNNTEKMRIDSAGKVGIGTDSPSAKLHIYGDYTDQKNVGLWVRGDNGSLISLTHAGVYSWGIGMLSQQSRLSFVANRYPANDGTEVVSITSSGQLGIGVTTPSAKLEVMGGTLGSSAGDTINVSEFVYSSPHDDKLVVQGLRTEAGSSWENASHKIKRRVDLTDMGYIQFGHYQDDLITFGEGDTEYMRIDGGGRVGINMASPAATLQVKGTGGTFYVSDATSLVTTAGGQTAGVYINNFISYNGLLIRPKGSGSGDRLAIEDETNKTEFIIKDSGYVGIGVKSPVVNFQVGNASSAQSMLLLGPNGHVNSSRLTFGDSTSVPYPYSGFSIVYDSQNNSLIFRGEVSGNDNVVFRRDSGYVGIGTSSPSTRFHIKETASSSNLDVKMESSSGKYWDMKVGYSSGNLFFSNTSDIGVYRVTFTPDGKVGIGTSSPELKLDVEGDIEVGTGTTGCVRDSDNTTIAGTCSSDLRLKQDVESLESVLVNVSLLRPVTFKWIGGNVTEYGLIAQEVREVMPELVSEDDQGYLRVSYDSKLFMLMLESIIELEEENDNLSADNILLRNELCGRDPTYSWCEHQ